MQFFELNDFCRGNFLDHIVNLRQPMKLMNLSEVRITNPLGCRNPPLYCKGSLDVQGINHYHITEKVIACNT
jgi:hypothetical protein